MSDMGEIIYLALKVMLGLAVVAGVAVGAIVVGLFNWLT